MEWLEDGSTPCSLPGISGSYWISEIKPSRRTLKAENGRIYWTGKFIPGIKSSSFIFVSHP
jgi:hypothetical protein